ncbi:MAG: CocE/NonD family hydrolase, partial [Candidatus Binatia bacterium]
MRSILVVWLLWTTLAIAIGLFAGCSSGSGGDGGGSRSRRIEGGGPALMQRVFNATVQSFDGTVIAFTVFQPALAQGIPAPLILHSHGFGGSRIRDLNNPSPLDQLTSGNVVVTALRRAWNAGYFVISFDERGFGESGGTVQLLDPNFEGRDIQAVLDWAEANLRPHLGFRGGDPVVGALGASYGGGFQLIGAAVDPRFDAIVPTATWNDLRYSLNPGNVPKSLWLDILATIGLLGSQGRLDPFLVEAFLQAQVTGIVPQSALDRLFNNSLQSFCAGNRPDGRGIPRVDALLVQGVTDTLFNMNEAVRNRDCLASRDNDVRLLVQRTGHLLPLLQVAENQFGFGTDPTVRCGNHVFETAQFMLDFLDEKLLGVPPPVEIPRICIVLDDTHGLVPNRVPVGGQRFAVAPTPLTTGPVPELVLEILRDLPLDTLLAILAPLGDNVINLVLGVISGLQNPSALIAVLPQVLNVLPPELLNELTTAGRFVPFFVAQESRPLAGIPIARIDFTGAVEQDPIVFLGLGRQTAGG